MKNKKGISDKILSLKFQKKGLKPRNAINNRIYPKVSSFLNAKNIINRLQRKNITISAFIAVKFNPKTLYTIARKRGKIGG
jgi:hypothetical protein